MKKFIAAAVLAALIASPAYAALSVGAKAPDFATQGSLGGKAFDFKLTEALKKGPVVIYFFPAAYTSGCTAETKAFADAADHAHDACRRAAQLPWDDATARAHSRPPERSANVVS